MKLKSTLETECFISDAGYYVIRQIDPYVCEDIRIALSPQQLKQIIVHMTDTMADTSWWDDKDEA